MWQHFRLARSGRILPSHRLSAEELDARFGVTPGSTFARTGVQFRRRALFPETATTVAGSTQAVGVLTR